MNIQIEQSNIELEGYYVRDLHFSVQPGEEETDNLCLARGFHVQLEKPIETGEYPITFNINAAGHDHDISRYQVVLSLATDDQSKGYQPPYRFNLTIVGFFRIVGLNIPKPTREPNIIQASVSLLYSSAREILAASTARGPFPGMILPVLAISLTLPPRSNVKELPARQPKKRALKKATKKK